MWIEAKKRNTRSESLFVFNFTSEEEDCAPFFQYMREHVDKILSDEIRRNFVQLLNKLESRCDSKYANDNVAVSSFLFADEMADWATCLIFLSL